MLSRLFLSLIFAAGVSSVSVALAEETAFSHGVKDGDLEWAPCPDIFPESCRIAVLHGDPSEPRTDLFFKVPAGTRLVEHTHTSAERMVLVSGAMEVDYAGQEPVVLEAGDYAYGPPELPHSTVCLDRGDCVLFIAFNEPVDAMAVDKQAAGTGH